MAAQRQTSHPTRLRQIALVSNDLARAKHLLTHIFQAPVIFEDPAVEQWGLKNFLMPIGGDIIEVVAPFKEGTTAGRLLDRRGEGGYMIIMQTTDAEVRREEIEAMGKKVIFSHPFKYEYPEWEGVKDEGWCIQYHPKGMMGGMMPELDSHAESERNKDPLGERFSPWHACGKEYGRYVKGMKEAGKLHLLGCMLKVREGDKVEEAAEQWSGIFGIPRVQNDLTFTNCSMGFVEGRKGEKEGLVSVTVGIEGNMRLQEIERRAKEAGVWKDDCIEMVGVKWSLTLMTDAKAHI